MSFLPTVSHRREAAYHQTRHRSNFSALSSDSLLFTEGGVTEKAPPSLTRRQSPKTRTPSLVTDCHIPGNSWWVLSCHGADGSQWRPPLRRLTVFPEALLCRRRVSVPSDMPSTFPEVTDWSPGGHVQSGDVFCLARVCFKLLNYLSRFENQELALHMKRSCVFQLL